MLKPNQLLFYMQDPAKSAAFYEMLFDRKPVASFPTYVAFEFENDFIFSLWSTTAKNFVSKGDGHRSELSFMVDSEKQVRHLRNHWAKLGVRIEQDLHEAVFGLTFVALDLDDHRLRVCMPDKD